MTDPHTPDQIPTPDQTPENDASVLAKQFDPKAVEPGWAAKWRNEPFRADATSGKEPFTIVIPPPNVTGNLRSEEHTSELQSH